MRYPDHREKNIYRWILIFEFLVILYVTCLSRNRTFYPKYELQLFWSYIAAVEGNDSLAWEIVLNVLLFVPFGYLAAGSFRKSRFVWMAFPLFSLGIELVQLLAHRGLFEFDDIISNSIGGMIGVLLYELFSRYGKQWMRRVLVLCFLMGSVLVCAFVVKPQAQTLEREFYFQAAVEDSVLKGECFALEKDAPDEYSIVLRSDSGTIKLPTQCGIERLEVASYFGGTYDYTRCGFTAEIAFVPKDCYEILVDFKRYGLKETGCYLADGKVVYCADPGVRAQNEVTEKGYLLLAQNHCYVYQYQGNLYWFMDDGYDFEADGSTYVQYQLWTTQTERLPQHRIEHGWYWDNIGFVFEDCEVESCGEYRVAVRPLPTEYPITAIVTGYHKDGKWIWKKYFRPVREE